MKSLIRDERADSMSMLVIVTSIFSFGLFYIIFTSSLNAPIQCMNQLISDGMVSADTKYFYELSLDMWKASPFFMILGLILYCYERGKGTDLDVQVFFEYMFLMIISITICTYLVYGFGLAVDGITSGLDISILTDVSDEWASTWTYRLFMVKMIYYFCLLLEMIGTVLYIFHPIMKQTEVTLFRREKDDDDELDLTLGQF